MNRRTLRRPRPTAEDESGPRAQLLEAAGQVFAERGFDRATGKEISERAGTNAAAINYYYGGMEGLYAEVLAEARRRIFAAGMPPAAADAKARLAAFIQGMVGTVTAPAAASWVMRVVSREVMAPTPGLEAQKGKEFLPRAELLRGLVAELTGLPADDAAVARCSLNILAPLCMLLICDRRSLKRAMPMLGLAPADAPALAQHLTQYALAGLAEVSRDTRRSG